MRTHDDVLSTRWSLVGNALPAKSTYPPGDLSNIFPMSKLIVV
ncbi:hypothetical protein HMPREF1861_00026 [Corynebacterium kroppenstedtii]|nr:hypothetical protein HMPREF1861_00026 [Corynebacterium kroppenstedtii]